MPRGSDQKAPHLLDIALGARIRLRRKELGLSQTELAKATDITFQQVQKYETGANRVSFSRLVSIAHALSCSVGDLIDTLNTAKPPAAQSRQIGYLTQTGAQDLIEAYMNISSLKNRRALLSFARALARGDSSGDGGKKGRAV